MKRRIVLIISVLVVLSLLVTGIMTVTVANRQYREESKVYLSDLAELLAQEYRENSPDPAAFAANSARALNKVQRISIIARDGTVLGDSVSVGEFDDHSERPEIVEAFRSGSGQDIRYSETVGKQLMYVAKRLDENTVLRVSLALENDRDYITGIIFVCALTALACVALAVIFASRMTDRALRPLDRIQRDMNQIASGDYQEIAERSSYREFAPLLADMRDVSRRLRSYIESIEEQSRKMSSILVNMHEGLLLLDEQGTVLLSNPAANRIMTLPPDIDGRKIYPYLRRDGLTEQIQKTLGEDASSIFDVPIGSDYYRFYTNPVKSAAAAPAGGMIVIITNITKQKKVDQMRVDFVANVSHELKTPLTTIKGYAEMLGMGYAEDDEQRAKCYDAILRETDRLIHLTNDLLRLSELDEAGEAPEQTPERISLPQMAGEICEELAPLAQKKNVSLAWRGEGEIIAPRGRVFEMLYNLVDNAVNYNRDGGRVTVLIDTDTESATIRVEDTGIGIPKEECDRVFERFYRVDKSRSRKSGGTGLGLSIVRHIVMELGGEIELQSELDRGTVVTVKLKAAAPRA